MVSFDTVYGPLSIIGTALSFFTMALGIAIALFAFLREGEAARFEILVPKGSWRQGSC
jgi:hypothetical protein